MRKIIDETGNRYGKIVVVSYAGQNKHKQRLWHCKCDCGKSKIILGNCLRSGQSKSCGCLQIKDRTGKRYGKLVVIEYVGQSKFKVALWKCLCDCGNTIVVNGTSLQSKNTKSCGCLRRLPRKQILFNGVFGNIKRGAGVRGYSFDLSKDQVRALHKETCFYCGKPPSNTRSEKVTNENYIYSGIDRVENNKGYIMSNCVPCCADCNYAKGSRTMAEFLDWLKRVMIHSKII